MTVTGVGTGWNGLMQGGIILFTASGTIGYIKAVGSGTSLTLSSAITVSAGSAYIIYYAGLQAGAGSLGARSLTLGAANVSISEPSPVLNILGGDGTSVATSPYLNFYTDADGWPVLQVEPTQHGSTFINFDTARVAGGSTNYRSGNVNGVYQIGGFGAAGFLVRTKNSVTAGTTFAAATWVTGLTVAANGGTVTASGVLAAQATSNQVVLGITNTVTLNAAAPVASRIWTFSDLSTNPTVAALEATQSFSGTKHFSSLGYVASYTSSSTSSGTAGTGGVSSTTVTGSGTSFPSTGVGGIIVFTATNTIGFITAVASGTSLTVATAITVSAGSSYVLYSSGVQSGQGYVGALGLVASSSSNQILLGSGSTVTTITTAPAAARTITLPDAGTAAALFVLTATASAQTIAATTNLDAIGYMASATSSLYSTGTAGTGGASSVTVTGSGTGWNGLMTGGRIVFTASGISAYIVSVQSGTSLTVATAINVANGAAYTIKYGGFQMAQDYAAAKGITLGSANVSLSEPSPVANILGTDGISTTPSTMNFYTNADGYALIQIEPTQHSAAFINFDCARVLGSTNYRSSNVGGNYQFIAAGSAGFQLRARTGVAAGSAFTVGSWVAGLTLSPDAQTLSTPGRVQVTGVANQLMLGPSSSTAAYIITAPTPSANRTYTIADMAVDTTFAMLDGPQTFPGIKNFAALGYVYSSSTSLWSQG